MTALIKQHLIDPEICIRCYTCEETCPIDAITHNDDNVVVDVNKCNYCMDCIAPCPTGSIDNWRLVETPYGIEEQFEWEELPAQMPLSPSADTSVEEAFENEIASLLEQAHSGTGGRPVAPDSAASPTINLFSRSRPAIATVQGNFRLTDDDSDSDVRHIILNFGDQDFPFLEGQSIGIAPPPMNGDKPAIRLYSVASPRDGEKPHTNNLALTVKREAHGKCSNYICDLNKGDRVEVSGPFGGTFLMPNDTNANLVMVCTGTGAAPFRAMTERRRRVAPDAAGKLLLFFGARTPEELPYFGPLNKLPDTFLKKHLVYSRVPGTTKEYVQDRMRKESDSLAGYLADKNTYLYVCGLKDMETGVEQALEEVCLSNSLVWEDLKTVMRSEGRYHVETY